MESDRNNLKLNKYFPKKPFDLVLYALFALAIVKLFDLYGDINEHDDNWPEYKQQHHCQLKITTSGNQESAWVCDDGKTYYRWRQLVK